MKCPVAKEWDQLVDCELDRSRAEALLTHTRACQTCRESYETTRRNHLQLVRMYEALDRDHEVLRDQLMAALPADVPGQSRPGRVFHRKRGDLWMMLNTKTTRRTAAILLPAACLFLAVVIFLVPGQKSAFATAIEHLKLAKMIACQVTTTIKVEILRKKPVELAEGQPPEQQKPYEGKLTLHEKLYMDPDLGVRRDTFEKGQLIRTMYHSTSAPTIILNHVDHTYQTLPSDDQSTPAALKEAAARHPLPAINFMSLPQDPDRLIEGLRNLTEGADRELGHETIGGRDLIGYEINGQKVGFGPPWAEQSKENRAELWADSETGRVVRLVFHYTKHLSSMMGKAVNVSYIMTTVYDQFDWDPAINPDWFTAAIPKEYVPDDNLNPQTQATAPDETKLLESLQQFEEIAGRYPKSLNITDISTEVAVLAGMIRARQIVAKQKGKKKPEGPDIKSLSKLTGLGYFALLNMQGREPKYFGADVKPGQAEKVLMQWHLKEGGTRVIYGDLRVETLAD